ncbi:CLUMA_CG004642, isoform A [Clunio marinus]|uniref:CLUMA_CG004642, isoform A n=1 Tax=Clunio marinus TaxID=568069 RepID=A0A1J1HXS4_9DIPT|nr:CLUMA_CG004642, isoform A [Clunio marinus]
MCVINDLQFNCFSVYKQLIKSTNGTTDQQMTQGGSKNYCLSNQETLSFSKARLWLNSFEIQNAQETFIIKLSIYDSFNILTESKLFPLLLSELNTCGFKLTQT